MAETVSGLMLLIVSSGHGHTLERNLPHDEKRTFPDKTIYKSGISTRGCLCHREEEEEGI